MTQDEAYDEIVRIGREHALIYQASGGTVLILHPDTQRAEGLYDEIQRTHGLDVPDQAQTFTQGDLDLDSRPT